MSQVLIREVEPAVVERLKQRAKQSGRSLEAELRLVLQRAANEEENSEASATQERSALMADVERVRALLAGRTFSDSVELLREDRER